MAIGTSFLRRGGRRLGRRLGHRGLLRLALGTGFLAAVGFRYWLTTANVSPWIMVDELIFSDQARSIAHHGNLDVRGGPYGVFSLLYPVLIAPGWLLTSGRAAYETAKAINSVLVTLGAVPLFLWARRLLPLAESVLVCALALLIPPLLLAGNLMSDNAFFPAFLLAAFSIALALERPTYPRQALALGAVALACAVRLQGLVLLVVFPTAVLLHALLEPAPSAACSALTRLRTAVRPFLATAVVYTLALVAYVAVVLAAGANWLSALGGYHVTAQVGYAPGAVVRWIVYQFGELDLVTGLVAIPAALALFVWALQRRSDTTAAERGFLAVTISSVFWLVIQTGVFASRFAHRVEERLMFYVVPLLLLALVLWLWRHPAQSKLVKLVAFAVPAALVVALPLGRLLVPSIISDTFGLIPFDSLLATLSLNEVRWIIVGAVLLAGAIFVAGPRATVQLVVPVALAAFLAVSSVSAARDMSRASRAERATSNTGQDIGWIDAAVGAGTKVGFLLIPEVDPRAMWQQEFWNQALDSVFALGPNEPGGLPDTTLTTNRFNGLLGGGSHPPAYLVTPRTYVAAGRVVARQGFWVLYRTRVPLRLTSQVEGVSPDGWIGHRASDTVYRTSRTGSSTMTVRISRTSWGGPDEPSPVRIEARSVRDGRLLAERAWVVHSLGAKTFHLGRLEEPYRVSVFVKRTFSPADFGLADQRQLGAQVAFHRGSP